MSLKKPGKVFAMSVLFLFCMFIFRGNILAKRPPNTINLKVKLQGKFRYKKQGGKVIPVELVIKGKAYKFIKQGGKWGIKAPLKDIIQSSPECKQALHLAMGELALVRIRDIIKGDRSKAQKLVNDFKAQKKAPEAGDLFLTPGPSNDARDLSGMSTSSPGADVTANSLHNAYNKVLNSQAFLYPLPQPGLGGWKLVTEEDAGGDSEEEEEEGGFFAWLAMVVCVLVVIIAPIAAVMWLAATALTIATATMAFLGMIGAFTVASVVGATLNVVDDVINGRPLIEIWN